MGSLFMKTKIVDVTSVQKELTIEIDANAIREVYDRVTGVYAKRAKVPGFRPGHAPNSVVRTRFKNEITGDVLRELVPQAVNDAIREADLRVIGEPEVHLPDAENLTQDFGKKAISIQAHVEILPEIKLQNYKGLELTRRVRPVTDTEVDNIVDSLREASASLRAVEDRPSELGDTVTANFKGKYLNSSEEDIEIEDVEVTLGAEGVEQAFTDNLLGTVVDDEKTFTIVYPPDFSTKDLAGKEVEYTAKVTAVRVKELPELDDEWAQSLGDEYTSLEATRSKIVEDLTARANSEADRKLRAEAMDKVIEAHDFELPPTLVEKQIEHLLESFVRDLIGRGIDPASAELDWKKVREEFKSIAERDLRSAMLLEKIAEEENISVSDQEVEDEIKDAAEATQKPLEQVRAILTKDGGTRSIANRLRSRKTLNLIVDNARVTEGEWIEESSVGADSSEATQPGAVETEEIAASTPPSN